MRICNRCFVTGNYYEGERCDCGGTFVQAGFCRICGDYFVADKYEPDVDCCEECYDERVSVENAIESGADSWDKVKLNGFITEVLSTEEMEKILIDHILAHQEEFKQKTARYCHKYSEGFKFFLAEKYCRFDEP